MKKGIGGRGHVDFPHKDVRSLHSPSAVPDFRDSIQKEMVHAPKMNFHFDEIFFRTRATSGYRLQDKLSIYTKAECPRQEARSSKIVLSLACSRSTAFLNRLRSPYALMLVGWSGHYVCYQGRHVLTYCLLDTPSSTPNLHWTTGNFRSTERALVCHYRSLLMWHASRGCV